MIQTKRKSGGKVPHLVRDENKKITCIFCGKQHRYTSPVARFHTPKCEEKDGKDVVEIDGYIFFRSEGYFVE